MSSSKTFNAVNMKKGGRVNSNMNAQAGSPAVNAAQTGGAFKQPSRPGFQSSSSVLMSPLPVNNVEAPANATASIITVSRPSLIAGAQPQTVKVHQYSLSRDNNNTLGLIGQPHQDTSRGRLNSRDRSFAGASKLRVPNQFTSNDYYSVQTNGSGSRNLTSATQQKTTENNNNTSTIKKASNTSASTSMVRKHSNAVTNRTYTMIKSSNIVTQRNKEQRAGISGRMQKQFHQYNGHGGGSPPFKGQRTSMMTTLGGGSIAANRFNGGASTIDVPGELEAMPLMTLIPIRISNNKESLQDIIIGGTNNLQSKLENDMRHNKTQASTSRERSNHRGQSYQQVPKNQVSSLSKAEGSLFVPGNNARIQQSLPANRAVSNGMALCSNHQKVINMVPKQQPQAIIVPSSFQPANDDKSQVKQDSKTLREYHPEDVSPRNGVDIPLQNSPPQQQLPGNQRNNNISSSLFFKSPVSLHKTRQLTLTSGGSPALQNNQIGGNRSLMHQKTIVSSRLSTGGGGGSSIKKNLNLNAQQIALQQSQKSMLSRTAARNNNHTQQPGTFLQIDLAQLSTKNIQVPPLNVVDSKLTIEDVEDTLTESDQNPFNVYGAHGGASPPSEVHLLTLPATSSFHDAFKTKSPLTKREAVKPDNGTFFPRSPKSITKLNNNRHSVIKQQSSVIKKSQTQAPPSESTSAHKIKSQRSLIQPKPQQRQLTYQQVGKSLKHIAKHEEPKSIKIVSSNIQPQSASVLISPIKPLEAASPSPPVPKQALESEKHEEFEEEPGAREIVKSVKSEVERLPMTRERFVQRERERMGRGEVEEMERWIPKEREMVYFTGLMFKEVERENKNEEQPKEVYDDEDGYYIIHEGDHLLYRYEILKTLGKGSFAQVVSCFDHRLGLPVAVKITRNTELDHKFALSEAKLLQYLMENDPRDENNIVRLRDEFMFREHHCFVFELLPSGDLFEHLKATGFCGFEIATIKEYAREILRALVFLEQHKIIHCDLKPENILLVDQDGRKKLKLVDFGSGSFRGEQAYTYVQSRFYRAPEVILRLLPPPQAYTEKVDIWSLGCILAELYTGEPIFPGNNEQEQLELIMEICGIPQASLVDRCRKKDHYFDTDYSPFLIEDEEQGILRIPESKKLEQVISCHDEQFLDFLRKCLVLDPELRFGASEAIQHPWLAQEVLFSQFLQDANLQDTQREEASSMSSSLQQEKESSEFDVVQRPLGSSISSSKQAFLAASSVLRCKDESPDIQQRSEISQNFAAASEADNVIIQGDNDSSTSTPKNEGGIQPNPSPAPQQKGIDPQHFYSQQKEQSLIRDADLQLPNTFLQVQVSPNKKTNSLNTSVEKRRDREARKAAAEAAAAASVKSPSKGMIVAQSPMAVQSLKNSIQGSNVKIIGQYEIFREDNLSNLTKSVQSNPLSFKLGEGEVRESMTSHTSGIASEANIPPVNTQHQGILSEESQLHQKSIRVPPNIVSQQKHHIKSSHHHKPLNQHPIKPGIKAQQQDTYSTQQSNAPLVTNENSINKITITFYQKRNHHGAMHRK